MADTGGGNTVLNYRPSCIRFCNLIVANLSNHVVYMSSFRRNLDFLLALPDANSNKLIQLQLMLNTKFPSGVTVEFPNTLAQYLSLDVIRLGHLFDRLRGIARVIRIDLDHATFAAGDLK